MIFMLLLLLMSALAWLGLSAVRQSPSVFGEIVPLTTSRRRMILYPSSHLRT